MIKKILNIFDKKLMRLFSILSVALLLLRFHSTFAQQDTQLFAGYLNLPNDTILCLFELEKHQELCKSYLSIPGQMAYRFASSQCKIAIDSIFIQFAQIRGVFTGKKILPENTIIGEWQQNGQTFPIELKYAPEYKAKLQRPQHPQPPLPYVSKEIQIQNKKEKLTLSGTLTLPDTLTSYPLVILIAGSGPMDRDQTVAGHKTFLVLSDFLTRQGIAVFRYDKRGVGKSTGNFSASTTFDFARDVECIIDYFRKYPYIHVHQIVLLGHSEGALIGMIVASRNKHVRLIITLAAPAVTGMELLIRQTEDLLRVKHSDEEFIDLIRNINIQVYNTALIHKTPEDFRAHLTPLLQKLLSQYDEDFLTRYGLNTEHFIQQIVWELYSSPWLRSFLTINPNQYIRKIKCSWLALYGTKDLQVHPDENSSAIEQNYKPRKHSMLEIRKYNNLNHLFQNAKTGHFDEYMLIPETIHNEVLEDISHFIKNQINLSR